MPTNMTVLNSS